MVKIAARVGILLAILSLHACVFYLSPFSQTLTQMTAKRDLTGIITAGEGNNYQPFVVTTGGQDFVILTTGNISLEPQVIILDANLNMIQAFSSSQLLGWGAYSGYWVMIDDGGYPVIGNYEFAASSLASVPAQNPFNLIPAALNRPSFSSASGIENYINFQLSGVDFQYTHISSHWTATTATTYDIPIGGPSGLNGVQTAFNAVDNFLAGQVVLVLNAGPTAYFLSVPLSDFHSNIVGTNVGGSLFGYPSKAMSNLESTSIGFAGNCLVAYSYDTQTINRYDLSFNLIDTTTFTHPSNQQLEFSYKSIGGFFVTYNPSTLQLVKYATWW
jgi:hypothetical protein